MDEPLASVPGPFTLLKCDVEGHEDQILQVDCCSTGTGQSRHGDRAAASAASWGRQRCAPTMKLNVARHQLDFLGAGFPVRDTAGYVTGFVFFPSGARRTSEF